MTWFTLIPYAIQWAIVIIAGLTILGIFAVIIIAILKRVKLKFGNIEADPQPEEAPREEVKK
jgi:hypothetical protein